MTPEMLLKLTTLRDTLNAQSSALSRMATRIESILKVDTDGLLNEDAVNAAVDRIAEEIREIAPPPERVP